MPPLPPFLASRSLFASGLHFASVHRALIGSAPPSFSRSPYYYIYMYIQPPEMKSYSFPGGCRPRTPRTGGRAFWGTHFGLHFWICCVFLLFLFVGFRLREVAHLFSREISHRMPSESYLGTPWGPSYEHICKNVYCKREILE